MKSDKRRLMDAPCGVDSWNTKLRIFEKEYPNVSCSYRCTTCGFNPHEKARRLTQGHIVKETISHKLHNDLGEVVHIATNVCDVLHFTKETENA